MNMSPGRLELRKAIIASANSDDGCAENLKRIVEEHCTLPLNKAYEYVKGFKDMEITRTAKHGRPLRIKVNKEKC
jgi:hypothetical protein